MKTRLGFEKGGAFVSVEPFAEVVSLSVMDADSYYSEAIMNPQQVRELIDALSQALASGEEA